MKKQEVKKYKNLRITLNFLYKSNLISNSDNK